MAEKEKVIEKAEEKVEKKPTKKGVDVQAFIKRKLQVINAMPDGAKKRKRAERVLKNKEAK